MNDTLGLREQKKFKIKSTIKFKGLYMDKLILSRRYNYKKYRLWFFSILHITSSLWIFLTMQSSQMIQVVARRVWRPHNHECYN